MSMRMYEFRVSKESKEYQNRNFGPTNTIKTAMSHSPKIHPYSIIRPHQPFPSLILRSIPIRCPAASIVVDVLSMPVTARSSMDFSFSSVAWNEWDDAFSWLASDSSELVRSSCSIRSEASACSLDSSLFGEVLRPVAFAVSWGVSWLWRLRSVEEGVVAAGAGGDVVVVVVGNVVILGSLISLSCFWSTWTRGCVCAGTASAMGVENKSFHSSSASTSSASASFSARASSSSRIL